ncbi:hypothetical protein CROQUDRAFT_378297 [Cronartium quercuum f. sp. fusiforme G11]|uniref:Uncharacterized protein n=1 Tax=Cronartium quercuum f. sp. fusiforme G11 TaxID=708437 RepID=A0A9P6TEJ5_9BASI|nr:hypothetical protein CROQUDRAFT_378297 [Cronartium quercuum f. sp. fusiforme G11]
MANFSTTRRTKKSIRNAKKDVYRSGPSTLTVASKPVVVIPVSSSSKTCSQTHLMSAQSQIPQRNAAVSTPSTTGPAPLTLSPSDSLPTPVKKSLRAHKKDQSVASKPPSCLTEINSNHDLVSAVDGASILTRAGPIRARRPLGERERGRSGGPVVVIPRTENSRPRRLQKNTAIQEKKGRKEERFGSPRETSQASISMQRSNAQIRSSVASDPSSRRLNESAEYNYSAPPGSEKTSDLNGPMHPSTSRMSNLASSSNTTQSKGIGRASSPLTNKPIDCTWNSPLSNRNSPRPDHDIGQRHPTSAHDPQPSSAFFDGGVEHDTHGAIVEGEDSGDAPGGSGPSHATSKGKQKATTVPDVPYLPSESSLEYLDEVEFDNTPTASPRPAPSPAIYAHLPTRVISCDRTGPLNPGVDNNSPHSSGSTPRKPRSQNGGLLDDDASSIHLDHDGLPISSQRSQQLSKERFDPFGFGKADKQLKRLRAIGKLNANQDNNQSSPKSNRVTASPRMTENSLPDSDLSLCDLLPIKGVKKQLKRVAEPGVTDKFRPKTRRVQRLQSIQPDENVGSTKQPGRRNRSQKVAVSSNRSPTPSSVNKISDNDEESDK